MHNWETQAFDPGKRRNRWIMKKFFTYVLLIIIGIAVGLGLSLAAFSMTGDTLFNRVLGISSKPEMVSVSTGPANVGLMEYAYDILGYIKAEDYNALSQAVHPEYGVVFSPYATINLSSNKRFTAVQVGGFSEDKNKYVWGKYDGIGDPIELTPSEYFKMFVFERDFTLAPEIGVNTIIKTGNSLENIKETFPNACFIDFHIPGTDPDAAGLDWSSLRLGFEEYKGELKLTVILHSQWTI